MTDNNNQSNYYDENATMFIEGTVHANMEEHYTHFLKYLEPGSLILDAGCGSGRDVLNFSKKGFRVIAFDASLEMVKFSSQLTGLPIQHCDFLGVTVDEPVSGIWACASLLHIDLDNQKQVLRKYRDFLDAQGVFFLSYKYGEHSFEKDGRTFHCHTPESLTRLVSDVGGYQILEVYVSGDIREGRQNEQWCSAVLKKGIY